MKFHSVICQRLKGVIGASNEYLKNTQLYFLLIRSTLKENTGLQ